MVAVRWWEVVNSGYSFQVEPKEFPNRLGIECKRQESRNIAAGMGKLSWTLEEREQGAWV